MNLPGIKPGQIKLTGPILAGIYLGEIKKWNDPQIAAINHGVPLPNLPITVVHRSDGSGTTFIFSSYLSLESGEWKSKVGAGTAVSWPTGLGGKGSEGVSAFTKQTLGSIGYVEYAYALQNHLTYALMKNKQGLFVPPTAAAFKAAAAGVDWTAAARRTASTSSCSTSRAPSPGRSAAAPSSSSTSMGRRTPRRCWPSSTGRTRTATATRKRSTTCRCRRKPRP